jgi:hypothetical protein
MAVKVDYNDLSSDDEKEEEAQTLETFTQNIKPSFFLSLFYLLGCLFFILLSPFHIPQIQSIIINGNLMLILSGIFSFFLILKNAE